MFFFLLIHEIFVTHTSVYLFSNNHLFSKCAGGHWFDVGRICQNKYRLYSLAIKVFLFLVADSIRYGMVIHLRLNLPSRMQKTLIMLSLMRIQVHEQLL